MLVRIQSSYEIAFERCKAEFFEAYEEYTKSNTNRSIEDFKAAKDRVLKAAKKVKKAQKQMRCN